MTASTDRAIILNSTEIEHKVNRMAYEIAEDNIDEKEIFLIGIKKRGTWLAKKLSSRIKKITDLDIHIKTVLLDKRNPLNEDIDFKQEVEALNGKVVILVDDVANSGRTMCYAIKPLLEFLPKKIRVAVLVDRMHKQFPIISDYVGLSLSTTLQEYITFDLEGEEPSVYLD